MEPNGPPRGGVRERRGRLRERRGRGPRGPWILPGPLSPAGVPAQRAIWDRFDAEVLRAVAELEQCWPRELGAVQFGVEDVPWVDDDWRPARVPMATLVPATSQTPTRIVVYRLPIRARALTAQPPRAERDVVVDALVEQVAELLGLPVSEADPRRQTRGRGPTPATNRAHSIG